MPTVAGLAGPLDPAATIMLVRECIPANGRRVLPALGAIIAPPDSGFITAYSAFDFEKLKGAPDRIEHDLVSYIKGFSSNVRRIFEYFEFENEIEKMGEANILYLVVSKFCDVDLHPDAGPNRQMGLGVEPAFELEDLRAHAHCGTSELPRN